MIIFAYSYQCAVLLFAFYATLSSVLNVSKGMMIKVSYFGYLEIISLLAVSLFMYFLSERIKYRFPIALFPSCFES